MIPYGKHSIDESDIEAVLEVLRSPYLTQGPKVAEFEKAVVDYTGAKFAVAVSHGTAALHLSAIAANLTQDSSLVTSPITFVASANAALYVGADVVFADIDPITLDLSPDSLRQVFKNNNKIKVVMPVHFAGLPCDMPAIKSVADDASAVIIEDAAHALGASYLDGTKVGCCSHSLMTVFSFHPVKTIAAGEGGMITTNDADVYMRLLRLRSHGINKDKDSLCFPNQQDENGLQAKWYYEMQELGFNYRITDIQSALGLSQFNKIDRFIDRRRQLVRKYDQAFAGIPGCKPVQKKWRDISSHHIYVLRIDYASCGLSRQSFMEQLLEYEIISQVHYIPVPLHPLYQDLGHCAADYPHAMEYYEEAISIPLYYSLSDEEQAQVIRVIKKILKL